MEKNTCTEHYGNKLIEVYECQGIQHKVMECEACGKPYERIKKTSNNPLEVNNFSVPVYSLEKV